MAWNGAASHAALEARLLLMRTQRPVTESEPVVSRRAAGRILALLFGVLGGLGNLPAAILPLYPTAARPLVVLLCAVLIAIGLALW